MDALDLSAEVPEKDAEQLEDDSLTIDTHESSTESSEPVSCVDGNLEEQVEALAEMQRYIVERIDSLGDLFNARIMHTDHEEKIVDQMHKELQKYKEDIYAQLVRPILLDIIEIRDSIMRIAATYLSKPEGEQSIPNKTFSDYAYDLQDILEKNSVEIYRSNTGDVFTPIKQRVVKKVATSDENLHGKVAESFSSGYSYNGRVISAEKISVYYYEKSNQEN